MQWAVVNVFVLVIAATAEALECYDCQGEGCEVSLHQMKRCQSSGSCFSALRNNVQTKGCTSTSSCFYHVIGYGSEPVQMQCSVCDFDLCNSEVHYLDNNRWHYTQVDCLKCDGPSCMLDEKTMETCKGSNCFYVQLDENREQRGCGSYQTVEGTNGGSSFQFSCSFSKCNHRRNKDVWIQYNKNLQTQTKISQQNYQRDMEEYSRKLGEANWKFEKELQEKIFNPQAPAPILDLPKPPMYPPLMLPPVKLLPLT